MILNNILKEGFTIGILVIVAIIVMFGIKNAPTNSKNRGLYTATQYTCSGKFQRSYESCINFRSENNFTVFDILDATDDIETVKLLGGIIVIEKEKTK